MGLGIVCVFARGKSFFTLATKRRRLLKTMAITKPFAHREWVSSFVRSFFFQRCFWLGALVTFSIFASFLQILCVAFISIVDLLIYSKTPSPFEATGISAFTSGRWRLLHLKHQTFQLFNSI